MRWPTRSMRPSLLASMLMAATVSLLAVAALVFAAVMTLTYLQPSFMGRRGLAETTHRVADAIRFDASGEPVSVMLSPTLTRLFDALHSDVFYRIVDRQGDVLLSSDGQPAAVTPNGEAFDPMRGSFDVLRGDMTLHVLVLPVGPAGKSSWLQVARSERFDRAILENGGSIAGRSALAAIPTALIVFGVVVFYTTRRMLQQLRRLGEAAARIDPYNLTQRLEAKGLPAEVVPLVEMFNSVLERLERGFRLQQEFLATAAHELKTPITLMRGQIELGGAADTVSLMKDLDHMARHVQQLLHLAEASEPQNYVIERVDIAQVASDAIGQLARLASAKKIEVDMSRMGPVMVPADRGAVQVLVRNLLENAIHHSSTGSPIVMTVSEHGLHVRDHGCGIAAQDMPLLFKRFWRGAHRRDEGAGLGLAICKEIAERHGWTVAALDCGVGAQFSVSFRGPVDGVVASGA
jgi:two-component system sensor histidine kinase QseC